MEENLPKDNLESFFRKEIKKQPDEPRADGWDTPDDAVWKGISGGLPPTPSAKGGALFLKYLSVFGMIVLLGGLGYWWKYMQPSISLVETPIRKSGEVRKLESNEKEKEVDLNENITLNIDTKEQNKDESINADKIKGVDNERDRSIERKTKKALDNASSKLPDIENIIIEKTSKTQEKSAARTKKNRPIAINDQIEEKQGFQEKKLIINEQKNTNSIAESIRQNQEKITGETPLKEVPSVSFNLNSSDKLIGADIAKNTTLETSRSSIKNSSPSLEENEKKWRALSVLPTKNIEIVYEFLPYSITDLVPVMNNRISPVGYEKRFYLGAVVLPNASTRVIKPQTVVRQRFERIKEQEQEVGQLTFGVVGGWQFHRNWSIESGVYQGKSTIESLHRIELTYRKDRERPSGTTDALESDYEVNLRSSYGDVNTSISIARNPRIPINDRQKILLLLQSKQDLNYVDIPLLLKYHGRKGAFNFTAKAGIAGRIVVNSKVEAGKGEIFPKINGLGAKFPRERILKTLDKSPNSSLNYMVGIGASYRIWNNLYATLEPTFSRSLQPVFEKEGVATYAQSLNWQVGVKYYLL